MLTYDEIHLLIEQGLNTLGLFSEKANLHEQIDLAVNHVIVDEVNRIVGLDKRERDAIDLQIAKVLSLTVVSNLEKAGSVYSAVLSSPSFLIGKSAQVTLASNQCSTNVNPKPAGYYRVTSTTVTYNGLAYSKNTLFKLTDQTKLTYGTVEQVALKTTNAIVVDADSFDFYSNSAMMRNALPVVAFDNSEVKVKYSRIDAVPVIIEYRALKELKEEDKLSWCKEHTLNLPYNLQHYFVNKVVAHLALVNEKSQQNIVNLKTETLV